MKPSTPEPIYGRAAGLYGNAGWPGVLPLPYRGKKNPPSGFTGREGVDPSPMDVHDWVEHRANGNIALRLPKTIIGIDVDDYGGKNGLETIKEYERELGDLSPTWRSTSRSGRSGIRLYRVPPDAAPHGWKDLREGSVETISHGFRYAIVWPSLHRDTGETYRWIDDAAEEIVEGVPVIGGLPDAPTLPLLPDAWIKHLAREAPRPRGTGAPLDEEQLGDGEWMKAALRGVAQDFDDLTWSPYAAWDQTIFKLACRLVGLSKAGWNSLALEEAKGFFHEHAPVWLTPNRDWPQVWTTQDNEAKWNRAAEYATADDPPVPKVDGQPGEVASTTVASARVQQLFDDMVARDLAQGLFRAHKAAVVELPATFRLDEYLAIKDPEVKYVIDGLWPVGGRVLLAAQYKAGKSTMVSNVIRSLADGDTFLDRHSVQVPSGGVFLVDDELADTALRGWLREQEIACPDRVQVQSLRGQLSTFDITSDKVRSKWAARIGDTGASVVILDCLRPLIDALGLSEDKDAGIVLGAFDELLYEASVTEGMIVHHMGHNGERSRGDSRLRDWPDAEWTLNRKDNEDPDSERFFRAYGRDVDAPEQQVVLDGRRLTLLNTSRKATNVEMLGPKVLKVVEDNPGIKARSLRAAVGGKGPDVDEARKQLIDENKVRREVVGGAHYFYPVLGTDFDG